MAKKARPDSGKRTLLLECSGGVVRKIRVDEDWIVTFGPIAVGESRRSQGESPNVLRVYSDAGRKNLKACHRDVISFHDEQVEVSERVIKTKSKTVKDERGPRGSSYTAEVRRTVWRDPFSDEYEDDEDDDNDMTNDLLALPGRT